MRMVRVLAIPLLGGCLVFANGCASVGKQEPVVPRDSKEQQQITELKNLLSKKQEQIDQLKKRVEVLERKLGKSNEEVLILRTISSAEARVKERLLEIVAGDRTEVVVNIKPASAVPFISFEIEDPNVATVEPLSASSTSQTLHIRGIKQGETFLIVRAEKRLCAKVTIEVQQPSLVMKLSKALKSRWDTLLLILICGGGYLIAYHTYGRFLSKKIFKLDKNASVPSHTLEDGIDYVPARKPVIFGHHFTSIAGTGPIVGPAIGIIWGWLPAVLWVVLGSILMGAVHDFGTLVVSIRNEGKSISEVAAKYINRRVRFIFFVIVFLALWIVIAIFGVIIALVFKIYPESVLPVWLEIPIAITLGWAVYKKGANLVLATLVAVAAMYLTVGLGAYIETRWPGLFSMPEGAFLPPTGLWTVILLIYAWIASTLPVNMLLQPRDYINAWQLFIAMGLLTCGAIVASAGGDLPLVAPAVNLSPAQAPPMWPFIFVVIACGAISGFHSLVASGTSAKQVSSEHHSLFVGYGSMLMESALAVLVIVCVAAGIGMGQETLEAGQAVWQQYYSSWAGEKGLATKIAPVVAGAANMMTAISLPKAIGIAVMGVFIASFAGTTLDTSVRIQRYVISELSTDLRLPYLSNRWTATTLAVASAAVLAFATGANGMGAMKLWPLFGTANQLLAALALLVVTMYLRKKGKAAFIVTALPCLIMLTITSSAMVLNEQRYIASQNWLLAIIGAGIFILALWMIIETVILFFKSPVAAGLESSAVSA